MGGDGDRWRTSIALAMAAWLATSVAAGAQPETPAGYPATPAPEECVVARTPMAKVLDVLAMPVAASPVATPQAFANPEGSLADQETAAAVVATLRQVFACANAGDPLRFSALYTDDFMREFYAGPPLDAVREFLSSDPQPLPDDQRRVIIDIGEVQLLEDGRAGVIIILDEPADPRTEEPDYVILEQIAGRWLVDEIHEG